MANQRLKSWSTFDHLACDINIGILMERDFELGSGNLGLIVTVRCN